MPRHPMPAPEEAAGRPAPQREQTAAAEAEEELRSTSGGSACCRGRDAWDCNGLGRGGPARNATTRSFAKDQRSPPDRSHIDVVPPLELELRHPFEHHSRYRSRTFGDRRDSRRRRARAPGGSTVSVGPPLPPFGPVGSHGGPTSRSGTSRVVEWVARGFERERVALRVAVRWRNTQLFGALRATPEFSLRTSHRRCSGSR